MGKKVYFENLDSLRTIACLIVIFQHSGLGKTLRGLTDNAFIINLIEIATNGGLGVSFFFVLSGFLITFLLLKEHQERGEISLKKFYMRRFLRIWPLYYAVVICGFFVIPFLKSMLGVSTALSNDLEYYVVFLSNFDLMQNGIDGLTGQSATMLNITWSVAIEEQFYLFWPLLFKFSKKRHYLYLMLAITLFSILFRMYYRENIYYLNFHTLSLMLDLSIGGAVAYLSIYSNGFQRFIQQLSKKLVWLFYAIGFLFIYLTYTPDYWPLFDNYSLALTKVLTTVFFAFVIIEQNFCKNSIQKLGRYKLLSKYGKYTYGMYLLHPIVIYFLALFFKKLNDTLSIHYLFSGLSFTLLTILLTVGISLLSYKYLELPFLKIKKKFQY